MKTTNKTLTFCACLALAGITPAVAEQKPEHSKKLYGEAMCAKCELKQGDQCATAIRVKDGEKHVIYHADANHVAKEFHPKVCQKVEPVKAVGNVRDENGQKKIALTHISIRENLKDEK